MAKGNLFEVVRPSYTHSFHKGNTNLKQAWPKCLQQERRGTVPQSRCNSDKGYCTYSHTNILSQATKTSRLMLSAQKRCSITEVCSWSSVQVLSFCHIVLGLGLWIRNSVKPHHLPTSWSDARSFERHFCHHTYWWLEESVGHVPSVLCVCVCVCVCVYTYQQQHHHMIKC
jgi:hypothetical protein